MKAVLFAPLGSRDADAHARRLHAAGWQITTWLELHSGCIARGRAYADVDQDAFRQMVYLLAAADAPLIIHPDTPADQIIRVVAQCRLLGVPVVHLHDVPGLPPGHMNALPALRKDIPLRQTPAWVRTYPMLRRLQKVMHRINAGLTGLKNPVSAGQMAAAHSTR